MITLPNGKICMNEQEAIQWLLDNYPIPFQCSANYAAGTEIGLGTIVNPTPAKVKVGSLIFFADSKVSTVVGLTANGFICSDQYNDLVDDVVYVSNVQLNASGHLIVTLSNNTTIDAGLIKQVNSLSINGSQHLIANYNDGTSTDLGAIFSGNITVSGNLTVSGGISGSAITGDSIIENMSGYSMTLTASNTNDTINAIYGSSVKNGNKLTIVVFFSVTKLLAGSHIIVANVFIPPSVGSKLIPYTIGGYNYLEFSQITGVQKSDFVFKTAKYYVSKNSNSQLQIVVEDTDLSENEETYIRIEKTFLLSDNLVA